MTLLDTLDGAAMRWACTWTADRPRRAMAYNYAITGLSVAAALGIGRLELAGLA